MEVTQHWSPLEIEVFIKIYSNFHWKWNFSVHNALLCDFCIDHYKSSQVFNTLFLKKLEINSFSIKANSIINALPGWKLRNKKFFIYQKVSQWQFRHLWLHKFSTICVWRNYGLITFLIKANRIINVVIAKNQKTVRQMFSRNKEMFCTLFNKR